MGELILNAITAILALAVNVVCYFLIKFLKTKMGAEELKQMESIIFSKQELAKVAILFAQQAFETLDGPEKYDKALDRLQDLLDDYGLDYTDEELEALIEGSLKDLKLKLGENWKKLIDEPTS